MGALGHYLYMLQLALQVCFSLTLCLSHSHHTANLAILSRSPSCGGFLLLFFCCGLMGGSDGGVGGWVGQFWVGLLQFWVGSNKFWVGFYGGWLVASCRKGGGGVVFFFFFFFF